MNDKVCIRALADIDQINDCKSKLEAKEETISKLSNVLALAGNDVRLKILYLLYEENELCVCDLSDILKMNVSAISQHLRKLKDGNMVDVRKEGQTYFYFVKNDYLIILKSFFNMINSKDGILKMESV
jgi:DNA-binding transcriptional ArsR family regulator